MICPEAGLWRAWLDDEAAAEAKAAIADHLAACPVCRRMVDGLRNDSALARGAIDRLAPTAALAVPDRELIGQIFARGRSRAASFEPVSAEPAAPAPVAAVIEQAHRRPDQIGSGFGARRSDPGARHLGPATRTPDPATRTPDPATRDPGRGTRDPGLEPRTPTKESHIMTLARTTNRWRVALGGLAAALVLTFLIGTPPGRTAAAQFLAQFRSQRFAVVTLDPSQRGDALRQLERLGTVQGTGPGQRSSAVGSIDRASSSAGFAVKQPDPAALPAELAKTPRIQVSPATEMRFTFDTAKARAYFDSTGRPDVALPDKFNGATLVVSVPAAVLLQYLPAASTGPGLMIGQASELTVGTEGGVTLDELRDFLLGLPGVSPDLARQLRAIQDWRNTLPIPVPADQVNWQQATIAGGQGLILADNTGLGSGAIWQRDGRVYGVAGAATIGEIQRVADSLQ